MSNQYNKYNNSKIYKIWSPQTEMIYIGSTTQKYLCQRLTNHIVDYNNYNKNKRTFISSFHIIKYNDAKIELLENFSCNNIEELNKREGELIRQYKDKCVNIQIAGRTPKEYREDNRDKIAERDKKYYEEHTEQIAEYHKKYREEHKEEIAENKKIYYEENKEKILEHNKKYRDEHKEQIAEHNKKYREKHKEEVIEKSKKYYEKHKEQIAEHNKKYRDEHKEEITENQKIYYEENKEKILEYTKNWGSIPFNCICGSICRYGEKARHFKSKKHQNYINSQSTSSLSNI
jgi:hypothetical protein